jgi:hypothetical protein
VSWLWIFIPVAVVIIAATVGIPFLVVAREHALARQRLERHEDLSRRQRIRQEIGQADGTPQSWPAMTRVGSAGDSAEDQG